MKPQFTILVGLPGAGKSFFKNDLVRYYKEVLGINPTVISSDDLIEKWASEKGTTYNAIFQENIKAATSMSNHMLRASIEFEEHVIIDKTNLTVGSRSRYFQMLHPRRSVYSVVGLNVSCNKIERFIRLAKRLGFAGKSIPHAVLEKMEESFQVPTPAEGFDAIFDVSTPLVGKIERFLLT